MYLRFKTESEAKLAVSTSEMLNIADIETWGPLVSSLNTLTRQGVRWKLIIRNNSNSVSWVILLTVQIIPGKIFLNDKIIFMNIQLKQISNWSQDLTKWSSCVSVVRSNNYSIQGKAIGDSNGSEMTACVKIDYEYPRHIQW